MGYEWLDDCWKYASGCGDCFITTSYASKKYLSLLLIGFVLTAYLNLPILGVSIVGLALAYYYFTTTIQKVTTSNLNTVEEIGDDFDG